MATPETILTVALIWGLTERAEQSMLVAAIAFVALVIAGVVVRRALRRPPTWFEELGAASITAIGVWIAYRIYTDPDFTAQNLPMLSVFLLGGLLALFGVIWLMMEVYED